MIPTNEVVLFSVTLKQQAGRDMYAGLSGRIEAAREPSLRCPLTDMWGQDWRQLAPGMAEAMETWHREGRFPPAGVVIHRLRTHVVDSSVRSFRFALSGLLQTVQGQPGSLRSDEIQLRRAPVLSPPLQALLDAGHLSQATELIRSMQDDGALRRLLLEVAVTHFAADLPETLFRLDPDGTEAALAALVVAERPGLLARLSEPVAQEWKARSRREALGWLHASLPCSQERAAGTLKTLTDAGILAGRGRGYGLTLREALLESVLSR